MFKRELQRYSERLLEGGMAWSAVRRHMHELVDHHLELYERALSEGLVNEAASARARRQLGDLETLAPQMLSTSRRSLLHRFPVTMNVVAPLLLLLACYIWPLFVLVHTLSLLQAPEGDLFGTAPQWLQSSLPGFAWATMHVLPLLLTLPLVFFGRRARVPWRYWAGGAVLLCLVGAGLDIRISWPDPLVGREGSIGYMLYGIPGNYLDWNLPRFLLNLLLVYGFARYWQERERVH